MPHLVVHAPKARSMWDWARPKSSIGARNSSHGSHVGTGIEGGAGTELGNSNFEYSCLKWYSNCCSRFFPALLLFVFVLNDPLLLSVVTVLCHRMLGFF